MAPTLDRVSIFGCARFIYNNSSASKFQRKAVSGIHLGVIDHGVYIIATAADQ